jgi:MFS family permease
VITVGLALTTVAAVGAIYAQGFVALGLFFLLGGMAAASTNAASGRVVVGWFPKERRGLAMGIRQTCQPLGVTIAALTIAPLAAGPGIGAAVLVPLALTGLSAIACAAVIVNPPRAAAISAEGTANPYRASGFLWRIHAVSALLVVPQFTLSTFGLVWLTVELGWHPVAAGVLIGVSQFVGALGRVGAGILSDRVGSRLRPLRWVAITAFAAMALLALLDATHLGVAAGVLYLVATTISVADNGLAFTSVAEVAGPAWAGRALGTQNTGQFIAASIVGPAVGALIGAVGYPLAFLTAALAPAVAVPLIPRADREHDRL